MDYLDRPTLNSPARELRLPQGPTRLHVSISSLIHGLAKTPRRPPPLQRSHRINAVNLHLRLCPPIAVMKNNKSKGKKPSREDGGDEKKLITDPRFQKMHSDPRFQKLPMHKAKVAIDARFNPMFTDKRFKGSSAPLDKRGKPKKSGPENPLRRYYRVEEEKEEEEGKKKKKKDGKREGDGDEEEETSKKIKLIGGGKGDGSESESDSDSGDEMDDNDYAELDSDSTTSATDTDAEEDEDVDADDSASDVEEDVLLIERETHRLAAVNMDWDRVKAVDLFVGLSSFLPKGGQIILVTVYPSEFGRKRMEEEAFSGPVGLFDDDDGGRDTGDDELDYEKVRAYEKSRLRYYFAVVECDSSATADYLYKACDGLGFGGEDAYPLDLRFIPDSVEFNQQPRDVANELPSGYEGLYIKTRGLQHTNILLSWDEDDPHRARTLKRKFNAEQLAELELQEFLASDASEEDNENGEFTEGNPENKYRALLQGNDESMQDEDEAQDMEVTFNTGLEDLSKKILEKKDRKSETAWEAYLRKRKEKKKARKNKSKYSSDDDESDDTDQDLGENQTDDFFEEEDPLKKKTGHGKKERQLLETDDSHDKDAEATKEELELLLADDDGAGNKQKGYKIKPKKAKGKKGKEAVNEDKIPNIDYEDPRFSALFNSPLFTLDPTDPQFKRSASYARQLAQQQLKDREELLEESRTLPRRTASMLKEAPHNGDGGVEIDRSLPMERQELSSLVKSIKMKSKQIPVPSGVKKSKIK